MTFEIEYLIKELAQRKKIEFRTVHSRHSLTPRQILKVVFKNCTLTLDQIFDLAEKENDE